MYNSCLGSDHGTPCTNYVPCTCSCVARSTQTTARCFEPEPQLTVHLTQAQTNQSINSFTFSSTTVDIVYMHCFRAILSICLYTYLFIHQSNHLHMYIFNFFPLNSLHMQCPLTWDHFPTFQACERRCFQPQAAGLHSRRSSGRLSSSHCKQSGHHCTFL